MPPESGLLDYAAVEATEELGDGASLMQISRSAADIRPSRQDRLRRLPSSYRANLHVQMHKLAASLTASSIRFSVGSEKNAVVSSLLDTLPREHEHLSDARLGGEESLPQEALSEKAVAVIKRVQGKLTGKDFGNSEPFGIPEQVDRLIKQATSNENLCQCFIGAVTT
ncbi:unnamed protein product [Chrysoparadoxa australica]